jgi:hypothetical protein
MQTVSTRFNNFAEGQVRPLSWAFRMSLDKGFDDTISVFTLDQSVLNGDDVLAPGDDNPLQIWDYYQYQNFTDRVISIDWVRELEFPNSVTLAMADVELENHDDYFTPDSSSPVEQFILPKRPLRVFAGFGGENIQQFVGLTEKMPIVREDIKTASFHATDFLAQLFDMPLDETIAMDNVRTDEVLAELFEQFGMTPTQYSLSPGANTIPFLFFEEGTKAGDVFRKLMEAEMGNLWLDEQGIIQFAPRVDLEQSSVYTFDDTNTIDVSTNSDDNIINKVIIKAEIRELQDLQPVYLKSEANQEQFIIPANGTAVFSAALDDPASTIDQPSAGPLTGESWFVAVDSDGDVAGNVTVTSTVLRTNQYVIFFSNTNAFDVTISELELWGEPAKVVDRIEYSEVDQISIDKYDEQVFVIENNFIQSIQQSQGLALMILNQFSEYSNTLELEVKGNFALQLGDVVTVNVKSYSGTYRIIKILNKLIGGRYTQVLTVRKYIPQVWFTLDESVLDGSDVLTP